MPLHIHIEFAMEPPKPSAEEDAKRILRRAQILAPALAELYKAVTASTADPRPQSRCCPPSSSAFGAVFGDGSLPPEFQAALDSIFGRKPRAEDDPDSDPDDEDGYGET